MNQPLPDVVVNQLLNNAIKKLIEGETTEAIFNYFISYGIMPTQAKILVAEACSVVEAMPKPNPRVDGIKSILKGFGWLILSVIIFVFVKSMGSVVVLPSGMALFGVAIMLNGLWKVVFAKNLVH